MRIKKLAYTKQTMIILTKTLTIYGTMYRGISKDQLIRFLVKAALQVTIKKLLIGDKIWTVTKSLHKPTIIVIWIVVDIAIIAIIFLKISVTNKQSLHVVHVNHMLDIIIELL